MRRDCVACVVAFAALLATAPARPSTDGQSPQTQVPAYRSAVALVPVDVRVLDRNGNPLTDLRQDEFTVLEDGRRQEVRHFVLQQFSRRTSVPDGPLVLRQDTLSVEPQANRIFLIVLGRGRLQEPSRALDALIRFVREQLQPQDQVAAFAYNRATAFTRDHARVAALLEQFRVRHEWVNLQLDELQLRGLAAVYGTKEIPKPLQQQIDEIFAASPLVAAPKPDAAIPAESQAVADARRQGDALARQVQDQVGRQLATAEGGGNISSWTGFDEVQTQMFADLSLDNFVSATAQTLEDLGNLYAAIEYLRHFRGEKHLVFLTERGLTLSRVEEDQRLAAAANDARVALDTVQTGGIYVGQAGAKPAEGRWSQTYAFQTLRNIAELTGGVSSITEAGAEAFERLQKSTSASYLLGYYPANATWDGAYRKIIVRVSRPNVTVLYRHGYFARKDVPAFSRRELITAGRIQAASTFKEEIQDVRLTIDASLITPDNGRSFDISVDLRIDPSKLTFTSVKGVQTGMVSIAVFCFDQDANIIASSLQHAKLELDPDAFQKALGAGIPYRVRFPADPSVRRVRAVVYEFDADLLGSVDKVLK